jgi:hypothetical protein
MESQLNQANEPPEIPEDAVRIFLGSNVAWTTDFPFTVISQGTEDLIFVEREGDGLTLSGKFFNKDGKIICELVKNQFHLNPANYFRIERTPHRLAVVDDEAKPIIELEFINRRALLFLGDFYLRGGNHVLITPDYMKIPGFITSGGTFEMSGGGKRTIFKLAPADDSQRPPAKLTLAANPTFSPLTPGAPLKSLVTIRNPGQEARIDWANIMVVYANSGDSFDVVAQAFESSRPEVSGLTALPPQSTSNLNVEHETSLDPNTLSSVRNGEMAIFLFGKVEYSCDTIPRQTLKFCYLYDPDDNTLNLVKEYASDGQQ